jgi:hypothetical protein
MRFIILLVLFISCEECETIKTPIMTISNAIPVQFWVNGVETFNEKNICGVEPVCFCQPFNCDDEIKIQFFNGTDGPYELEIFDTESNLLDTIDFIEVAPEVFQISFIPINYGICDRVIQFKIATASTIFDNTFTDGTLDGWTNNGAGVESWAWTPSGGGQVFVQFTNSTSKSLRKSVTIPQSITGNGTLEFYYYVSEDTMTIEIKNSIGTVLQTETITTTPSTPEGTASYTIPNAILLQAAYVDITPLGADIGKAYTYIIDNISLTAPTVRAQSDCIDIKTSHECTTLIEYTNSDDFNGIIYATSPTSEFNLRIPAQFWKEDNPMEQEDSELSNGVIKTRRQSIQEKTLLEIGYVPNYMHKKIQLSLMHDSVTIDGNQWKKRDSYESENIRRYPLKKANVWLTLYNSIEDNIL